MSRRTDSAVSPRLSAARFGQVTLARFVLREQMRTVAGRPDVHVATQPRRSCRFNRRSLVLQALGRGARPWGASGRLAQARGFDDLAPDGQIGPDLPKFVPSGHSSTTCEAGVGASKDRVARRAVGKGPAPQYLRSNFAIEKARGRSARVAVVLRKSLCGPAWICNRQTPFKNDKFAHPGDDSRSLGVIDI